MNPAVAAVTWDFGQTLASLDTAFLARRLGEREVRARAEALEAALPAAWAVYDRAIRAGEGGHPWKRLMRALLDAAGAEGGEGAVAAAVDWLWEEQPRRNLWRRPIPGMIELVRDVRAAGLRCGVVSNSEGRLAELVEELGWSGEFLCVADSGRLGIEKPARGIFDWAAERLGVAMERIVHVGDSRAADVEGALAAGAAAAIWFGTAAVAGGPAPRVRACGDAGETRLALRALGVGV